MRNGQSTALFIQQTHKVLKIEGVAPKCPSMMDLVYMAVLGTGFSN